MNKLTYESYELIKNLYHDKYYTQRILAEDLKISLGKVNKLLVELQKLNYINKEYALTEKSISLVKQNNVNKAIILAAGIGMRMIPINNCIPKALLNIKNEVLIERLIKQLHEKNIFKIYVVIGFMKEEFEYLIDKFNVTLIVNNDYLFKNNLHSLNLVRNYIANSYIIPCDLYFKDNPFNNLEIQSWYMVTKEISNESDITLNSKHELIKTKSNGIKMIGLSYINYNDAKKISKKLKDYDKDENYDDRFWETALYENGKMIISGREYNGRQVLEINTYENLRNFDAESKDLDNLSINLIANIFNTEPDNIKNITILKKGMTNKSFLFDYENKKFIMRIPGAGTDKMIHRLDEYNVYKIINEYHLSDEIVYMDPNDGYKISRYIENAHTCDINNIEDLSLCMSLLKKFHKLNLSVKHSFDIFEKIDFYESLRGMKSLYKDYINTKNNILSLKAIIEKCPQERTLTHIDAVPDNFLIFKEQDKVSVKLIDWEYASMQDPHVDIAMFCIYSLFNRKQIDLLIDIYFDYKCKPIIRLKIYCYIAICGLLWSNWCEYKHSLGIEFGNYSLAQYRYAKEYYKIANELIRLEKI